MKDDDMVKEFFRNRDLSANTQARYLQVFKLYSTYTGLTPTEHIDEAEAEEEARVMMRKRKIKTHLMGFKEFLYSKEYSELNIKNTVSTVRSFYSEFEIDLPRLKINRKYRKKETIDDIPTKKHLENILSHANLKYQAIILLMMSSGMGAAEIRSLSYGDFLRSIKDYYEPPVNAKVDIGELIYILDKKENENEVIVATWHITRVKTKMPYITFSTSESIKAILKYLNQSPPETPDSPLFRAKRNKNAEISAQGFLVYFNRLNKTCGYGNTGKFGFFHSHVLRKYYASTLYKLKIPELVVHWMLGHRVDPVTEAYFKSDLDFLKNQYIDCIPELSMEQTEILKMETDEYKELQGLKSSEVENKKRIGQLEQELQEQKQTGEKVEKLEAIVQSFLRKQLEKDL